ncbi:hypothetical protein [Aggregatilinea lenta]|uniref:hypothetical protein n=1 Tax=Aggregatilinea lenta TaxID=913108 RepID=UPI000E5A355F|nr:hypothetical protein [Aggregatilinea lenta]
MRQRRSTVLLDLITVAFLAGTIAVVAFVVLVMNDPQSAVNPFPPPTIPTVAFLPTFTPTATPSITPSASVTPLPSDTPTPSITPTPSDTPTPTPTETVSPTPVLSGATPFGPQSTSTPGTLSPASLPLDDGSGNTVDGEPVRTPIPQPTRSEFPFTASEVRYEANANDDGCAWLSVAGSVSDLVGDPLPGLAVQIQGTDFNQVQFAGNASEWGLAGFEFKVGTTPESGEYTLQLLGATGAAVSDAVTVETGDSCTTNVAVVEFVQNHAY